MQAWQLAISKAQEEREAAYHRIAHLISDYLKDHKPLITPEIVQAERDYDQMTWAELYKPR